MISRVMATKRSQWEKCSRLLLLNNVPVLSQLVSVVEKLAANIQNFPSEEKFRCINTDNKAIKSKIIDCSGGLEILLALGFIPSGYSSTGAKVLKLNFGELEENNGNDSSLHLLSEGLSWLRDTYTTCKHYADIICTSSGVTVSPCCEVQVQLRLPTAVIVKGGFMRSETLQEVKNYACCFFSEENAKTVTLSFSHEAKEIGPALLERTFDSLGLTGRESFIVLSSTEDPSHVFEKVSM